MKLLDFIREGMIDNEGEKNIKIENKQMRKKIKSHKIALKDAIGERDLIREKYIAILEEKGEGFNQYLFWQNKANEIEAEERELRKEINDIKKDLKDFSEIIGKLFNKEEITSLAKCENYEDFLAYALRLYYSDRELPLKGIAETCKKLEITKNMIKKDSEYLYHILNVEKWEIE